MARGEVIVTEDKAVSRLAVTHFHIFEAGITSEYRFWC